MRRIIRPLAVVVLAAVTTASGTAAAAERGGPLAPDSGPLAGGKLRATADQPFVGDRGPETLKGPNLQPVWGPADTGTWGQDTYDQIRAKGFTSVRFVLFWSHFEPAQGQWNETAFTVLSKALARAKAAGLYVVMDSVHLVGEDEGQRDVPVWARETDGMEAVAANGLGFLKELASRYGDDETVAAYDPVNEPHRWPVDHAGVLADYTKIVNAIRTVDADTSIVIEPTYGDAKVPASAFASFTPSSRTGLIWSFHDYYVGDAGEGYDANGVGKSPNASDGTTGYNASGKANMATHLQVQIDIAARAGMPLWIGEFGIGAGATGHDQFIKDKVALYKSKGIGYAWWEYSDDGTFAMVDGNDAWKPWVSYLF
ncbi:glycoside hydrolase family 5 protein [Actinomadura vinacea]